MCERCGQVFLHLCFTWFLFINLDMGLLTQQISMLSTYCMSSSLLGLELWFSSGPIFLPQEALGNVWRWFFFFFFNYSAFYQFLLCSKMIQLYMHIHSFSNIIFCHVLSQMIGYTSLCCVAGPHCLPILNVIVCIY